MRKTSAKKTCGFKPLLSLIVAVAPLIAAFAGDGNPFQLLAPAPKAKVSLLTAKQREYFAKPRAERIAMVTNAEERAKIAKIGTNPAEVKFKWRWDGCKDANFRVEVRRVKDGRIVRRKETPDREVKLRNFELATEYAWRVTAKTPDGSFVSEESRFVTDGNAPRFVHVPGIPSLRDLGGRIGLDGRRVRQGRIYRSGGLNNNAKRAWVKLDEIKAAAAKGEDALGKLIEGTVDANLAPNDVKHCVGRVMEFVRNGKEIPRHYGERFLRLEQTKPGAERLNPRTQRYMTETLGIRTDIDLRTKSECYGMNGSPLGAGAKWVHVPSSGYGGMAQDWAKKAFAESFRVMLDEVNYPIDFHCIAGADRTGSLAFVLNGLLGVEEELLWQDWEINCFIDRNPDFKHAGRMTALSELFNSYPGKTLADKCEAYVISCGFTRKDVAKFREMMLEPKQ